MKMMRVEENFIIKDIQTKKYITSFNYTSWAINWGSLEDAYWFDNMQSIYYKIQDSNFYKAFDGKNIIIEKVMSIILLDESDKVNAIPILVSE